MSVYTDTSAAREYGRALIMGPVGVIGTVWRFTRLVSARCRGWIANRATSGFLTLVRWLIGIALFLTVTPYVVNQLSAWLDEIGFWDALDINRLDLSQWIGLKPLILTFVALHAGLWLARARQRVVIEDFVDYTTDDAKAVSGLATLLIAELGELRELYRNVNDQLSIATSVGVSHRGGAGGPTELGRFLTVRADGMSDVLTSAVASESKIHLGPILLPIGTVVALFGRLARGPRVLGSVHLTDAGGPPVLTAQIVGRRGGGLTTWRVDAPAGSGGRLDRELLDPMVAELACRVFTDLTLEGAVRWRAIRAFSEYLRLYWESLRTPKNRARCLRSAEGKLLEAIAEDDAFDLAYYNLGVIYSQLAETERRAAAVADHAKRTSDPEQAHAARIRAAVQAFRRGLDINPGRLDAVYALAVHRYTEGQTALRDGRKPRWKVERDELRDVVDLCDRVLKADGRHSQAHDLKGLALVQLDRPRQAVRHHRKAVRFSWRRLCDAEFEERAHPPTQESVLPGVRENAASALRNLAIARSRIPTNRLTRWLGHWRSDINFHQAMALAPPSTRAAMEFARGELRQGWEQWKKAADSFGVAARMDRGNPAYWAHLARARGHLGQRDEATYAAGRALSALAVVFRRSYDPNATPSTITLRDGTIDVLRDAAQLVDDASLCEEIDTIVLVREELDELASVPPLVAARRLRRLEARCWGVKWAKRQAQLARAEACGRAGLWHEAQRICASLIAEGDAEPALFARLGRALRKQGRPFDALTHVAEGLLRDPLDPVVRREVGRCHLGLQHYGDALEIWRHTLWLTPNDPFLHSQMGLCLWRVAQDLRDPVKREAALIEAKENFANAAVLFGLEDVADGAWAVLWRGRVSAALDDYDAAIPDLRSAAASDPTRLPATMLLGEAYLRTGDAMLGTRLLEHVRTETARAPRPTDADTQYLDDGWGRTLSVHEVRVRALCALALSEASERTHAQRLELVEEALVLTGRIALTLRPTDRIADQRSHSRLLARCLDARGELRREEQPEAAIEDVTRADRLAPDPLIKLHLLELFDDQASVRLARAASADLLARARTVMAEVEELSGDTDSPFALRARAVVERMSLRHAA